MRTKTHLNDAAGNIADRYTNLTALSLLAGCCREISITGHRS